MSDFEMATLRQRALEASARRPARRAVDAFAGRAGVWTDGRHRSSIRMRACSRRFASCCQKFDELGSTRQALLWLRRERISVPDTVRAAVDGRPKGAPHLRAVHGIITNPFLAGAYVYGRTQTRSTIVDGRIRRTSATGWPSTSGGRDSRPSSGTLIGRPYRRSSGDDRVQRVYETGRP